MFDEEFTTEKARNPGKSIQKLMRYVRRYAFWIIAALLCAAGSGIATVVGPDYLGKMADIILGGLQSRIDIASVTRIAVILAVIYLLNLLLSYVQGYIMASVGQRISQNMRTDIDSKIGRLPLRYFDGTTIGNVLSRVTNDVDTIGMTLNEVVVMFVSSMIRFVGALVMMLWTNLALTAVSVVTTLVGFGAMALIIRVSQKYFCERQELLGTLNGYIEEQYSGYEAVKAFGCEERVVKDFCKMNNRLFDSVWKSEFYSGLMNPIMIFVGNFRYLSVCVVGAVMAMKGYITFGTVVAFIVYVRLFSDPLNGLSRIATTLQSTAAAAERVFDMLESEEMEDESYKQDSIETATGKVEFRHIRFGCTPEKTIIHDFSAKAYPGQKIAIVGPTGAGKTTLVNLLMRFYEPDSGSIRLDGIDTTSITRENLHDQFCMVLQDTWLFEGTIRENLVYVSKDVSEERLDEAVKAVGLNHYIRTLPNGYDTVLSDRASLSAGQKQQITIARAIIKNAPILILDEATSSVDTRTELLIQEAMDQLMEGRTSFVIAHRLSTIKNADLILCVKDGDIVESGTHSELLAQNGFYADLYNSQFHSVGT